VEAIVKEATVRHGLWRLQKKKKKKKKRVCNGAQNERGQGGVVQLG
jgi:hypothetical protein